MPLVPRSNPTFANMRNCSALVVWPWDAVPYTAVALKLLRQAAAFNNHKDNARVRVQRHCGTGEEGGGGGEDHNRFWWALLVYRLNLSFSTSLSFL